MNREINAALADDKINAHIAELGSAPIVATPAEFGAFIASETDKMGQSREALGCTE